MFWGLSGLNLPSLSLLFTKSVLRTHPSEGSLAEVMTASLASPQQASLFRVSLASRKRPCVSGQRDLFQRASPPLRASRRSALFRGRSQSGPSCGPARAERFSTSALAGAARPPDSRQGQ